VENIQYRHSGSKGPSVRVCGQFNVQKNVEKYMQNKDVKKEGKSQNTNNNKIIFIIPYHK
jgi:hypothetical protein